MSMRISGLAFLALLLLAACGETRTQRVVTGAAGGAVAGEVLADEPVIGAVGGGLLGAAR
jgi:hypothetical protein